MPAFAMVAIQDSRRWLASKMECMGICCLFFWLLITPHVSDRRTVDD